MEKVHLGRTVHAKYLQYQARIEGVGRVAQTPKCTLGVCAGDAERRDSSFVFDDLGMRAVWTATGRLSHLSLASRSIITQVTSLAFNAFGVRGRRFYFT